MAETDSVQSSVTGTSLFPLSHTHGMHFHRLAEVRQSQNFPLTTVAKRLNMGIEETQYQEHPTTDLKLSQLLRWQQVLDVPLAELLVDPDEMLDNPIQIRAKLVRIMKTARSIMEQAHEEPVQHLAQTLHDQLIEIMPELKEIPSWPSIGQSRESRDFGQALYRRFDSGVEQKLTE